MSYKNLITKQYCQLLGESIKKRLKEMKILQNQIGYDRPGGDVELLSETTVGQIIQGKRNLTFNASLAFQSSLNYQTPRDLFFPTQEMKIQLIHNLISVILTDPAFDNTFLKMTLNKKITKFPDSDSHQIMHFITYHHEIFLTSLSNFISDFPDEETSYQIGERITDWLSEFACLISQL